MRIGRLHLSVGSVFVCFLDFLVDVLCRVGGELGEMMVGLE